MEKKGAFGKSFMKIPLTRPVFDKSEEIALTQVLRSEWVTQGPKVAEFEEAVKKFTGAKYAVATTSATTALFLSLYLLGIKEGDEVIIPSLSFIATANVVVHVGAKPVFVDVDPKTFNLDPKKVEEAITNKTKAIIAVDQIGLPCDLKAIYSIAKKYNLLVIEDGACALGSKLNGKMVGSFGEIVVLSFHPRKAVTTGDGGMILTKNSAWANKLKMLRHHGMSISDLARHSASKIIHESYPFIGFNFRMTDLQASVGIEQMKKLPKILAKRTELANRYNEAFKNNEFIIPPYVPEGYTHNYQSYMIKLKPNKKSKRDKIMQKLLDKGIATRFGVMASHLEPVYKKMLGKVSLPITEAVTKETIILPIYYQMTNFEQDFVIETILKEVKR